jgi:hypothetical protein
MGDDGNDALPQERPNRPNECWLHNYEIVFDPEEATLMTAVAGSQGDALKTNDRPTAVLALAKMGLENL